MIQIHLFFFEVTASYLLPHYPIARKKNVGGNICVVYISYTSREAVSFMSEKNPEIGNTGVMLWLYTKEEYGHITEDKRIIFVSTTGIKSPRRAIMGQRKSTINGTAIPLRILFCQLYTMI